MTENASSALVRFARRPYPRRIVAILLFMGIMAARATAGVVTWLDPYDTTGNNRWIPDISGAPGDSVLLAPSDVIDIIFLGDGFLAGEEPDFLSTSGTEGARGWYERCFGHSISEPGYRPFNFFKQAFRVRAIFEESPARAGGPDDIARNSFYRVKLDEKGRVAKDDWHTGDTGADADFRQAIFTMIDNLTLVNDTLYPSTLDNSVQGEQPVKPMADRYRNIYIVMSCRGDNGFAGGRSVSIQRLGSSDAIMMGMGNGTIHEFGHTFGYLRDEYISPRDSAADPNLANPPPAIKSIFNLSNITFSNERCDLLWPHLAPGGKYNPKARSLVGNLWVGSSHGQFGSWHSEYACEINGAGENYRCSYLFPDTVDLRDRLNYCFWCEEILAIRILERTGELARLGGTGEVNQMGRIWYALWDSTWRDDYYSYFNYGSLIAAKNKCYELAASGDGCATCSTSCFIDVLQTCPSACDIREVGNAIYVDPSGAVTNDGKKAAPLPSIPLAVAQANAVCAPTPILILKRASYPGPITISDPAILITDGCLPVLVGD